MGACEIESDTRVSSPTDMISEKNQANNNPEKLQSEYFYNSDFSVSAAGRVSAGLMISALFANSDRIQLMKE